ncbi:MAG: site-specific integrase [Nitrospiraceae bacterium]
MARRGDGLYLRGSTWYLDCRIEGVRHVVKLGKQIKRTVAGELANIKRAAILKGDAGIGKKRKDVSFEKAKEAFLDWTATNKRPRTLRVYRQQIERLARSFSTKTLSQISSFDLERHKRIRVEAGARVQANREIAVLKNLFNKAKTWGMYEGDNPALGVRLLEEPKRRLRYLEPSEEAKLLDVAREPLRSLIIVGTNTGIRIGAEALTLQWSDVDLTRGFVTVQAAYSKNGQTRNIPLNSRAKEAFRSLKGISRSDYVFSKPNGLPYKSMEKPFLKACEDAGLAGTGVSLHTLRHTFASSLVMAGVDLVTVQQYGGWSDLSLVQRYSHLSASHKAKAIETIAERFHNTIHNSPVLGHVVELAEQRVSV